jgi:hypothetical protein
MRRKQRAKLPTFCGFLAIASTTVAADRVTLTGTTRNIPERGLVASALMTDGKRQESFILPPGWRMGTVNKGKKVILQSEDYGATLEIISRAIETSAGRATSEQFRDLVLARSVRSKVTKEYVWPTSLGRAFAFEVEELTNEGLRLRSRALYIVRDGVLLEVSLVAQADKFGQYQRAFETVVGSWRSQ